MASPSRRPIAPGVDLLITITGHQELWQVSLLRLETGKALASAAVPPLDLKAFEERFLDGLRRNRLSRPEAEAMGAEMAEVLFPKPILRKVREEAAPGNVRVYVSSEAADCQSLPWEFARLDDDFVCLLPWLRLGRHISSPVGAGGEIRPRTKVLVVHADPGSKRYPPLASALAEADAVVRALRTSECRGIEVDLLANATHRSFQERLDRKDVDVVHFVGHGDQLPSGSALILEGSRKGEHEAVYSDELIKWFSAAGVRLAVLSGCLTGAPTTGIGPRLVQGGVDAVVAMQFPIADASAFLFSRAFYASLKDGAAYEDAVYHGRSAINGTHLDWGIPVLLTSSAGTKLRKVLPEGTATEGKHNVPSDDRPFIGRSKELRALKKAVLGQQKRLITITGMGGMGKTRLARQFARSSAGEFQDGVCFVECEALDNDDELRAAIAAALRLEDVPATWDGIASALRGRGMLLVLDCFERLTSCVRRIDQLLKGTDRLKILVTSRILLGLTWEQEYVLHPMSPTKRAGIAEGMELFIEAAMHADPNFRATPENRKALASLVEQLEAVPLAIVLAAGRLRHLSLEELQSKVAANRLEVVRRRAVGGDDRHENLIRVVDDSFGLLNEADRSLAFRLSVFRGGFYVEDAEAVLADVPDVREGIYALRDNSLLTSQIVDSRMRFRSLDTIREYIERVAPEELKGVARPHAAHFARKAKDLRRAADGGKLADAHGELWREAGNFRAAIAYAVEAQDSDLVRGFASALARPYLETGARSDFDYLSVAADRHAVNDNDQLLRIELSGLQGALYRREGDLVRARDLWLQRSRLAQEIGDTDTFADSLLDVADLAFERKDFDSVDAIVSRVESLGDRLQSLALRASGMLLRAKVRIEQKELAAAISLAEEVERLVSGRRGDRQAMYVWFSLAQVYRRCGSLAASERLCRHMVDEGLSGGYTHYMGRGLLELSLTLEEAGDVEGAAAAIFAAAAIPRAASTAVRQEANKRARQLAERHGINVPKPTPTDAWEDLARAFAAPEA